MDLVWFALLGLFFAGYFALDGFDIGAGMLLRRAGRTELERRSVFAAVGPFFLGNEVWLVATGGVLFGAFPALDGSVLNGLYPLITAGLLLWLVRDACVWFRSRIGTPRWRGWWDTALVLSSTAFAVFWGLLVGALLSGLPEHGVVNAARMIGFYPLLWAVVVTVLFAVHGAAFLMVRAPVVVAERAKTVARKLRWVAAALLVLAVLVGVLSGAVPSAANRVLPVVLLTVAAAGGLLLTGRRPWATFAATAFAAATPVLLVGIRSAPEILNAAADHGTLKVLGGFAVATVPLILLVQGWLWWMHRSPVDRKSPTFF